MLDETSRSSTRIALFTRDDFAAAQALLPELRHGSYESFQDEREGCALALSLAGLAAETILVSPQAFASWCRHQEAAASQASLDVFAAWVAGYRSERADRPVCGLEPRRAARAAQRRSVAAAAAGWQAWRACIPSPIGADPDDYVALLLEFWAERPATAPEAWAAT